MNGEYIWLQKVSTNSNFQESSFYHVPFILLSLSKTSWGLFLPKVIDFNPSVAK